MKINDIILVSDLDGTIIPITGVVSQNNIDAIKKFKELGGIFTIATGRSPASAKSIASLLGVNGAIIANNGAVIYDLANKKTLWSRNLDQEYKAILKHVKDNFPYVTIIAITSDDKYFSIVDNITSLERDVIEKEKLNDIDNIPDNCCKILFRIDDKYFEKFTEYMHSKEYTQFELVASGGDCFEMMAAGINKGYPFEKLVAVYGKDLTCSVAIGDYYNDVEMIEKAGIGAAVSNAVLTVKQKADIVVKSCEEDGLADFIEYLIKTYAD